MPRVRREKCPNSIYHVIVRGNNREDIFRDYADRIAYLNRLKRYKEKFKIEIYAYCMMTNHVHLLIYDNGQDISKFMQGLSLSYAIYFNKKYDRCGHVFQGRFTSVMVKSDEYFIHVSKYIHLNPVKANIVEDAIQYNWSSFKIYMGNKDKREIVTAERIFKYFADNYIEARRLYSVYIHNKEDEEMAEVAITLEQSHKLKEDQREECTKANAERVFEIIEQEYGVSKLEIIRRNNKSYRHKRDICIYLMALATRMAYKELAELFYVQPAAIGMSIKRTIERMIENRSLAQRIGELMKLIIN